MDPYTRRNALELLCETHDFALCREIERNIHAASSTLDEYMDNTRRVAFNMFTNPSIAHPSMVLFGDDDMIHGTLLEKIENETRLREERFQEMLQEKYEEINESGFNAMLKCRRCGSVEVSYDEKQTRGADEAATVFCSCATCGNRWVMR
jgi:DNA-directed RNA polymerase subunit M/transcription elongation factor TFIIS